MFWSFSAGNSIHFVYPLTHLLGKLIYILLLRKSVIPTFSKGKLEKLEEPTHPNRARDCTPPRNLINQLDPMECCSAPQIGRQQDPYLKNVMEIAPRETESMHCHYPTEERMVKPLITHNGLTDIRYTTDKNKAIYESGVGVQYKLINVTPEVNYCKSLQNFKVLAVLETLKLSRYLCKIDLLS
jgi:hypothetical protein